MYQVGASRAPEGNMDNDDSNQYQNGAKECVEKKFNSSILPAGTTPHAYQEIKWQKHELKEEEK